MKLHCSVNSHRGGLHRMGLSVEPLEFSKIASAIVRVPVQV